MTDDVLAHLRVLVRELNNEIRHLRSLGYEIHLTDLIRGCGDEVTQVGAEVSRLAEPDER